ncbi:hypothetical protein, partial [Micromonospora echinofusca]|uniref:hypothetical protein n=1 Tax=Micromonospora echinofusca TaxID=47858 RepID=UPI001AD72F0F
SWVSPWNCGREGSAIDPSVPASVRRMRRPGHLPGLVGRWLRGRHLLVEILQVPIDNVTGVDLTHYGHMRMCPFFGATTAAPGECRGPRELLLVADCVC